MLRLATSATPLDAPSSVYANNRGPDFTTVFDGIVTATVTATDTFDLTFNLTRPFIYNPANGPLLLDVMLNAAPEFTGGRLYFLASASAEDVSRVYNTDSSPGGTVDFGIGVTTQFSVQPIPEPATMILLGTGLAGIGGVLRRRQQGKEK